MAAPALEGGSMSNPVLTASPIFGEPKDRGTVITQPRPVGQGALGAPHRGNVTTSTEPIVVGFQDSVATERMTYDDVVIRTGALLGLIVAAGAFAWFVFPQLYIVGLIAGLALGIVNAVRRTPSVPLIVAYAIAEGLALGGISSVFDAIWPGIAVQAVVATMSVFAIVLAAFASGKIRATPKFAKILLISMGGYFLYSLINLGFMWFGDMDGFGLNSNANIMGIPLGVGVGLFAVLLAAGSFVMDFDAIQRGVRAGVPRIYAWDGAFGLTVTLVWLYVEFLRLFAILRD